MIDSHVCYCTVVSKYLHIEKAHSNQSNHGIILMSAILHCSRVQRLELSESSVFTLKAEKIKKATAEKPDEK